MNYLIAKDFLIKFSWCPVDNWFWATLPSSHSTPLPRTFLIDNGNGCNFYLPKQVNRRVVCFYWASSQLNEMTTFNVTLIHDTFDYRRRRHPPTHITKEKSAIVLNRCGRMNNSLCLRVHQLRYRTSIVRAYLAACQWTRWWRRRRRRV